MLRDCPNECRPNVDVAGESTESCDTHHTVAGTKGVGARIGIRSVHAVDNNIAFAVSAAGDGGELLARRPADLLDHTGKFKAWHDALPFGRCVIHSQDGEDVGEDFSGFGAVVITAGADAGFVSHAGRQGGQFALTGPSFFTSGGDTLPRSFYSPDYKQIVLPYEPGLLDEGDYEICVYNPGQQSGCANFTIDFGSDEDGSESDGDWEAAGEADSDGAFDAGGNALDGEEAGNACRLELLGVVDGDGCGDGDSEGETERDGAGERPSDVHSDPI